MALKIEDRVRFLGPQNAVPFFKNSDVFIFPSVYEPFGLVVTEAITCGLVPLVSKECGAIELWPDRPPELELSADNSKQKWADAIRDCLTNPIRDRELAENAQLSVTKRSWDDVASEYDAMLALRGAANKEKSPSVRHAATENSDRR